MRLTQKGNIYLLIIFLSIVFSLLITTLNYFPHLGMAVTLSLFAIFAYKLKKDKSPATKRYLIFSLIFAVFLAVRSEGFVTFLNLSFSLFFGSLMLLPRKALTGIIDTLLSPVYFVFSIFFTKNEYFLEYVNSKNTKRANNYTEMVLGVILSGILLIVILPLLASVNPFFEKLVRDVTSYLNIAKILREMDIESFFIWVVRLVFALGFLFIIPKAVTFMNKSFVFKPLFVLDNLNFSLRLPMITVSVVLFIFFVTQIRFYLAGDEALSGLGVTLSEKSREVFGQLSVVAVIIFGLIYNNKIKRSFDGLLEKFLVGEGLFLVLMAYKSVIEYINMWGFTHKRLYGVTVATWILGVFVFYILKEIKQKQIEYLIRNVLIFTGILVVIINVLNFDYLIYHTNKPRTGQGADFAFLTRLSADSLSYKHQLDNFVEMDKTFENKLEFSNQYRLDNFVWKIEQLQDKYNAFDIRTWTLLDWLQYQQIKDINTWHYIDLTPLQFKSPYVNPATN